MDLGELKSLVGIFITSSNYSETHRHRWMTGGTSPVHKHGLCHESAEEDCLPGTICCGGIKTNKCLLQEQAAPKWN